MYTDLSARKTKNNNRFMDINHVHIAQETFSKLDVIEILSSNQ